MIAYERDTIAAMRAGQNQHEPLVSLETWREVEEKHAHLTSQHAAVEQVLSGQDKIMGLEGVAGAGKTTSSAAVREGAKQEGYEGRGLSPASRVAESGIMSGFGGKPSAPPTPREANEDVVGTTESRTLLESIT